MSVILVSGAVSASPDQGKPTWNLTNVERNLEGSSKPTWNMSSSAKCLADNIYHEARGDSIKGQIAVANTVINRVKSDLYPNTICGVVWQKAQYSWTLDKSLWKIRDRKAYETAKSVAMRVMNGYYSDVTNGATHYYEPTLVNPKWSKSGYDKKLVGSHLFMKMENGI